MIIETSLFAESLVADRTSKGPIFGVFMRVVSQVAGCRKGFWARGTFVGFHLFHMQSTVCHLQILVMFHEPYFVPYIYSYHILLTVNLRSKGFHGLKKKFLD